MELISKPNCIGEPQNVLTYYWIEDISTGSYAFRVKYISNKLWYRKQSINSAFFMWRAFKLGRLLTKRVCQIRREYEPIKLIFFTHSFEPLCTV